MLCAQLGEASVFCGDPSRQVTDLSCHGGARCVMAVDSLATSLLALREIVEQGEGAERVEVWDGDRDMFHPEREEVGHYYRILQLKLGRRYQRGDTPLSGPTGDAISISNGTTSCQCGATREPPTISPGCPIRLAQEEFNHAYCGVLHLLEHAFDGSPRMLSGAIHAMCGLKQQAEALMQTPTPDGLGVVGPTSNTSCLATDKRNHERQERSGKDELP